MVRAPSLLNKTDADAGTFREPFYLQSSSGWAYRSQFIDTVTYSTDPLEPEPLLGFGIWAKYGIHAWLSD